MHDKKEVADTYNESDRKELVDNMVSVLPDSANKEVLHSVLICMREDFNRLARRD